MTAFATRPTLLGNFLLAAGTLLIGGLVLLLTINLYGFDRGGLHQAVRYTVRFSALLFVCILLMDNLPQRVLRGPLAYFRIHRRGLGLGFACSITIHLTSVYLFLRSGGYLPSLPALAMDISAAILICLMTVTSNDFMQRALGFNRWKLLHRVGIYGIWFTLLIPFASRIRLDIQSYPYWCFSLLLIVGMAHRLKLFRWRRNERMDAT